MWMQNPKNKKKNFSNPFKRICRAHSVIISISFKSFEWRSFQMLSSFYYCIVLWNVTSMLNSTEKYKKKMNLLLLVVVVWLLDFSWPLRKLGFSSEWMKWSLSNILKLVYMLHTCTSCKWRWRMNIKLFHSLFRDFFLLLFVDRLNLADIMQFVRIWFNNKNVTRWRSKKAHF